MQTRNAHPRVLPLFAERWSPRAFDGSAIPEDDLDVILEAAALAPSAFNYQPWRFLYSHRDDANWEQFLSLLVPFNASWAKQAGVLLFIVSDSVMQQGEQANPSHSHSFDAGAAWAQMALQATALGYHAHGMTGIDFDRIRTELDVPESYRIEAAVAIGRRGSPDILPEGLRAREVPSGRKPVSALANAGPFALSLHDQ
jgi:nitroreductase